MQFMREQLLPRIMGFHEVSKLQSKVLDSLHAQNKNEGVFSNVWGTVNLKRASLEYAGSYIKSASDDLGVLISVREQPRTVQSSTRVANAELLNFNPNSQLHLGLDSAIECRALKNVTVTNWMDFHLVSNDGTFNRHASSVIWPIVNEEVKRGATSRLQFPCQSMRPTLKLDTAFLLASDVPPNNYCHFVSDVLPRLSFLRDFNQASARIISPILSGSNYEKEFIETICREQKNEWVRLAHGDSVHVNNLLYLRYTGSVHPFFNCSEWAIEYVRQLLPAKVTPRNLVKQFLIVDRSRRRLRNMGELTEGISKIGSYTYVSALEKLSIRDQAQLFLAHRHIVGPHGAAFTNIVFREMYPSISTEIIPSGNGMATFSRMSNKLGIDHGIFAANRIETDHPNYPDCSPSIPSLINFILRM